MKKILLYLVCCAWVGCLPAQRLSTYLEMAAKNNVALRAVFTRYHAALERVPQTGQLPDLQLAFSAFVLPIETRLGPQHANIGLRQMFPWFGTQRQQRTVAMQEAIVELRKFEAQKNALFFKVRKQYYRLYQIEKDIAVTAASLKILSAFAALNQKEYEGGLSDMANILRVKMAVGELETRLENLETDLEVAKLRFNVLLNRPEAEPVVVPNAIAGKQREIAYLRDSLWLHPAFAVLEAQKMALSEAEKLNELAHRPMFSLGLNYVMVGQRSDANPAHNGRDAFMPSVGVSLPLRPKAKRAREQELAQLQSAIALEKEAQHQELLVEFARVAADLKAAERRMLLYTAQVEQADQAIQVLMVSYSAGKGDLEDVLRMHLQHLDYELALDKAQADQLIAYAKIRSLIGSGDFESNINLEKR